MRPDVVIKTDPFTDFSLSDKTVSHIDWSDIDNRKDHFLLRASLAAQGRSLTLYEENHPHIPAHRVAIYINNYIF